ncbi:MAG: hypothetical protein KY429_06860 [Actinobacteria bacterium]|nr:hypothetical protein [Actinomycetota bacterium]
MRGNPKPTPETMLMVVLALLSVLVVLASVAMALGGLSRKSATPVVTRLPDVLFSPGPAIRQADGLATPEEPSSVLSPALSPVPSPARRRNPPPERSSPATVRSAPSQRAIAVSMSGDLSGRGGNRRVVYEVAISNPGQVVLEGVSVRAHVPAGLVWKPGGGCTEGRLPFKVRDERGERLECLPGPQVSGSDDSNVHGFAADLPDHLSPGGSIVVTVELHLDKEGSEQVTNHAHASSGGTSADSAQVTVRTV